MNEIVGSVRRAAHIMTRITAASQEQSAGIEQVSRAVSGMDEITRQNAQMAQQAAAAAGNMREQAQRLSRLVAAFRLAGA